MSQADTAPSTGERIVTGATGALSANRRTVLTGMALAPIAALPATAMAAVDPWDRMIDAMAALHPDGGAAAGHARAAGMDPADLWNVMVTQTYAEPGRLPVMMFATDGGAAFRCFRPDGEDG